MTRIQPDAEIRAFLQRSVGCALTGTQREQHLWFAYGVGANGKGTLLNTIQKVLGDYAKPAPPDLLIRGNSRHPTELAFLRGARMVVAMETDEGSKLDESKVKQLTGGDPITARFMGGDFFTFPPTHKLWLVGNHKPQISGTDHAIWRRPLLIDFPVVLPSNEQDRELPEKLMREASGILRWCLEGCLAWQREGLAPPQSVLAATECYRLEMDLIADFISERCVVCRDSQENITALHQAYKDWCEQSGERPVPRRDFGRRLVERGFQKKEHGTANRTYYLGIQLSREVSEPSEVVS